MKRFVSVALALLALALTASPVFAEDAPAPVTQDAVDAAKQSGDMAWMLTSTGLVLLMMPGLALFYGGMVRRKNVLGTFMHTMVALGIIGVQWVLFGYALAFGPSVSGSGLVGWSWDYVGLQNVMADTMVPGTKMPVYLHCMFQGMFAIITPALISGALAERIKFGPYCLFILLWATLVYAPLAHWVWALDETAAAAGWLGKMGALDFAGGTVVHIAAGFSGLAAILVLRTRRGYPETAIQPNSMVLTLVGAGLLWFGWFGFNAGSALGSSFQAVAALTATQCAAAAAAVSWIILEWIHRGKPTALGLASGIVAGLVAVTPAAGFVSPLYGIVIGLISGAVCYGAVLLKPVLKYDDSLDAFGVHGVGGFLGAILTGLFASKLLVKGSAGIDIDGGLLPDGNSAQVVTQLIASLAAAAFAFVVTIVLVKAIDVLFGFCVSDETEVVGLDMTQHGELGFDIGPEMAYVSSHGAAHEPRPATRPPNGVKRFSVVVEGAAASELLDTWSDLCQQGQEPPSEEFRKVYPNLTTVQGNRFNFRGGDPAAMSDSLQRLFTDRLRKNSIRAQVAG